MKVMFGLTANFDKVSSVYWEKEGRVVSRLLRSDGMIVDETHRFPTLSDAQFQLQGSRSVFRVVEIDIRSAFQYLGKSSQLVEMLPEVYVGPNQPE